MIAVLLAMACMAYAQANVAVKEQVTITVNQVISRTDVPPINVNGRTLVPIRGIFQGFTSDIGWFPHEEKVYIRRDCTTIWLQIGDAHAKVNDDIVPLAVPAMIYRGRTMVPLRFIAETLGASVNWNPQTETITITFPQEVQAEPQPAPNP